MLTEVNDTASSVSEYDSAPAAWFANFAALGEAQRHLQANLNPELTLDILGLRLQRQGTPHDYR